MIMNDKTPEPSTNIWCVRCTLRANLNLKAAPLLQNNYFETQSEASEFYRKMSRYARTMFITLPFPTTVFDVIRDNQ